MNIKQINLKHIASVLFLGLSVSACNMGSSSDKISDTTSTTATYSTPDTMQSAAPATMDTAASMSSDTTAMKSPAVKSATTSAAKKKGKAKAEMEPVVKNPKISLDKEGIYKYAEVSPSFPGGQNGIDNYINNNIEYPQTALDDSKEGRVGISFVVDETGKVSDAHTVGTKVGYGLDEEAVRVVDNMPKWTPGMVKGKPVKTRMTLPIVFQVEQ